MNPCLTGCCTNHTYAATVLFLAEHGLSRTHWNCWGCANIALSIVPKMLRTLSSCPLPNSKWGVPLMPPMNCCCWTSADCLLSFQLKTQLTETLSKLETEENERQKVAGDLYKVHARCYYSAFMISISGGPTDNGKCWWFESRPNSRLTSFRRSSPKWQTVAMNW